MNRLKNILGKKEKIEHWTISSITTMLYYIGFSVFFFFNSFTYYMDVLSVTKHNVYMIQILGETIVTDNR